MRRRRQPLTVSNTVYYWCHGVKDGKPVLTGWFSTFQEATEDGYATMDDFDVLELRYCDPRRVKKIVAKIRMNKGENWAVPITHIKGG